MAKLLGKLVGWLISVTIGINYLIALVLCAIFGGDFIHYSLLDHIFNIFK